jgi:hypothetical protein
MMHKTGNFVAKDSTGREYPIDIIVDSADGWTELRTANGEPVTRSEKGKYLLYWPIRVVTSDSPDAP